MAPFHRCGRMVGLPEIYLVQPLFTIKERENNISISVAGNHAKLILKRLKTK